MNYLGMADKDLRRSRRRRAGAIRWIPVALLVGGLASAQQSSSKWSGEWGRITEQHAGVGSQKYVGGRLDIADCSGSDCNMQITTYMGPRGYCSAQANLTIKSPSAAEAVLQGNSGEACVLTLSRNEDGGAIKATKSAGGCSSFCTGPVSFRGTFPFRQTAPFLGNDIDGCFIGASRARLTICADPALAKLERQLRLEEDMPLEVEDGMLRQCDHSKQSAECLGKVFRASISENERAERKWVAEATTPGDPVKADVLIDKISGVYRASFQNSDISGDQFTSTDSLTIQRASKTAIRYDVSLNFFNGHTCGRSGVAQYERNGSFVSHTRTSAGECYFEIIPTEKGVSFADPTLICRQEDCGMRGGFNGEGFTYAQKQSAHDGRAPP